MPDINLYDGPHSTVVGATGSGKSTLAAALYRNAPGVSIYIDPSGDETVPGETVDLRETEFDASVFADSRRVRVILPDGTGTEADMRAMDTIQQTLFALGSEIPNENGRFYLFIDESHEVAPLGAGGDNPVVRIAKRGRSHNIRLFLVSQSPADLSKKAVKQVHYHTVFALNDYSLDYLKRYGMPSEKVEEMVGRPDAHKFVIYDGYDLDGPYRLDESEV